MRGHYRFLQSLMEDDELSEMKIKHLKCVARRLEDAYQEGYNKCASDVNEKTPIKKVVSKEKIKAANLSLVKWRGEVKDNSLVNKINNSPNSTDKKRRIDMSGIVAVDKSVKFSN